MKSNTTDVYIYVMSKGLQHISAELTEKLSRVAGVTSVNINSNLKKLLDVSYNPQDLSALKLLKIIKQHGHKASLVGM